MIKIDITCSIEGKIGATAFILSQFIVNLSYWANNLKCFSFHITHTRIKYFKNLKLHNLENRKKVIKSM